MDWKKLQEALDREVIDAMNYTHALHKANKARHEVVMYGNVMLLSALARALAAGLSGEARSEKSEEDSSPEPYKPPPH